MSESTTDVKDLTSANNDSDESKTFDADYVKQLREEAKSYRQEKAALKKQFEEVSEKLSQLEAEKLTDVEKKEAKIKELEKQLADISTATKRSDVDNMILKAITGLPIVDVDAAILLINKDLGNEENINGEIVKKVVDNIIKNKPWLVSGDTQNIGAGNFAKQDKKPKKTGVDALQEMLNSYNKK